MISPISPTRAFWSAAIHRRFSSEADNPVDIEADSVYRRWRKSGNELPHSKEGDTSSRVGVFAAASDSSGRTR